MSTPIRVLIAEDNLFSRTGIASLLGTQPDLQVVGAASDGAQAVAMFRQLKPDVLVCDLHMPNFDGFQAITAIRAENPNARILVLTNFEGDENIHRALTAGAAGYVTKDIDGGDLFDAIRRVSQGLRYVPADIARQLAERTSDSVLTARELQVLKLVAQGLSNEQIGKSLGLSKKTAEVYVSRILEKLGASSRTHAVTVARQRGILPPET